MTAMDGTEMDKDLQRKAAKAVLDLKRNGWAVVEDVLPE